MTKATSTAIPAQDPMVADEFASLADTTRSKLVSVARRMLGNPADAEEAVQQALLQGWDAIGEFRSEATLYAWLRTILFNECLDILKSRRRVERSRLAVAREYHWARNPDPEQLLLREELERVMDHEIRCLPRPFREVMFADLATIDEERNRTYARSSITGMNLCASKALCHRARKSLRERMERRLTLERQRD